ncbi:eukaryotic translation initiation factor 5-like [Euphorbia lathyris]|uniref:eukaryotic translation initiation factor 5-like n=1 Tax=Euphorbia lathyris TaxID=212925 RepID=UPI003313FD10
MALQNIGASNSDDAFYRYKMPRMMTKIEGRGNGIKTNVVNMVEIAKALARPPAYTTKYFGNELGAQSKFDEKTGTSLVNGAHETAKLAGLLENFIKKYVQCYGCGNPETEIVITKTQMITLKCAACGFLSDVDMRDKLTTFILKNPLEQKKGSKDKKAMRRAEKERMKEGEAADEEMKKTNKKDVGKKKASSAVSKDSSKSTSKKKGNGSDEDRSPTRSQADDNDQATADDDEEDDDDDIQWQTDTSLEAAKQRIQEQLSAVTADMVMLSATEEAAEKAAAEKAEKTAAEKAKSAKKSPEREIKIKASEIENGNKSNGIEQGLVNEISGFLKKGTPPSQLKPFLDSLSGTPQEVMTALFAALLDGVEKGFSKEVTKKKNYLVAATQDEGTQMCLLYAIESFFSKLGPDTVKEVALVLKLLYDNDVLEEEFILEWFQKGMNGSSKNTSVWKYAQPFIEWLENAESESEDE